MGMKAPDKIADKKQIENVIRDPKTELERRFKDDPVTGTPATPRNQPTIDEIRDMIQKDPRYDKLTAANGYGRAKRNYSCRLCIQHGCQTRRGR